MMANAELVAPTTEDTQKHCRAFISRGEAGVKCQAGVAIVIDQLRLSYIVEYVTDYEKETFNKDTLKMLVETTRYHHPNIISQTVANKINSVANLDEFKSLMLELLNEAIYLDYVHQEPCKKT